MNNLDDSSIVYKYTQISRVHKTVNNNNAVGLVVLSMVRARPRIDFYRDHEFQVCARLAVGSTNYFSGDGIFEDLYT